MAHNFSSIILWALVSNPSKLYPNSWLPTTLGNAGFCALAIAIIQFSFLLLPWGVSWLGWKYPWGSNFFSVASQLPFITLLLLCSLVTACSLRRMMQLCGNNWLYMFIVGVAVLLLTALTNTIKEAIPDMFAKHPGQYVGAESWCTLWIIATLLATKPVFDHMLDRMHPRPSAIEA